MKELIMEERGVEWEHFDYQKGEVRQEYSNPTYKKCGGNPDYWKDSKRGEKITSDARKKFKKLQDSSSKFVASIASTAFECLYHYKGNYDGKLPYSPDLPPAISKESVSTGQLDEKSPSQFVQSSCAEVDDESDEGFSDEQQSSKESQKASPSEETKDESEECCDEGMPDEEASQGSSSIDCNDHDENQSSCLQQDNHGLQRKDGERIRKLEFSGCSQEAQDAIVGENDKNTDQI